MASECLRVESLTEMWLFSVKSVKHSPVRMTKHLMFEYMYDDVEIINEA